MDSQNLSNQSAGLVRDEALKGKAIFVTGGGSGLGAGLCQVLAASGADIIVGDLKKEKATETAESLRDYGVKTHALALDVGNPADAERAINEVVEKFGRIDVLINNAGTDVTLPINELSIDDWQRVINTNLHGPFLLTKFAAEHMKRAGKGQIVNIASTAAKRCWPNASAYHASKWGVLGFSHAMHAELRPHNIKVTAVIAGGMRTPFLLDRFPDLDTSTLQDPVNAAKAVKSVLLLPDETVMPEVMILPMKESSWP
jgi:NAD(P)-dependent dehydrogenase (short-subunit alcohol dehydrogenase family)